MVTELISIYISSIIIRIYVKTQTVVLSEKKKTFILDQLPTATIIVNLEQLLQGSVDAVYYFNSAVHKILKTWETSVIMASEAFQFTN